MIIKASHKFSLVETQVFLAKVLILEFKKKRIVRSHVVFIILSVDGISKLNSILPKRRN